MSATKTWNEKLHCNKKPLIKKNKLAFAGIPANSNMLIATPLLIEQYIQQIPPGKNVSPQTMRKDLALQHNADSTCPVTTGIFLRIVAEAGFEHYTNTNSLKAVTPFWRVVSPNSPLAKKLSFGQDFLIEQRRRENIVD